MMLLSFASPAVAKRTTTPLDTFVLPQPLAPILVEGCQSMLYGEDSDPTTWGAACQIVNNDPQHRVAATIRFYVEVDDAFNQSMHWFTKDANGTYSPGVEVKLVTQGGILGALPMWTEPFYRREARRTIVMVDRVLFADGSTYVADRTADAKAFLASGGTMPRLTPIAK